MVMDKSNLNDMPPIAVADIAKMDIAETMLAACDRHTLAGQRDFAILRLLIDSSLKRQQVAAVNVGDFDFEGCSLRVQRQYQRQDQEQDSELISLSVETAHALQDWLSLTCDPNAEPSQMPMFTALDRAKYGHRLTGTAIYGIVKRAARIAGISEAIAPEKLRFCHISQNGKLNHPNEHAQEPNCSHSHNQAAIVLSETGLGAKTPYILDEFSPNILTALLTDKRSLNTRRAYEKDLGYFFMAVFGQPPQEAAIAQFLQLNRFDAIAIVLRYKSDLIAKGLKESTINRRLSALKSLVNFAAKLGKCNWNLDDIQTETVQTYRDTTGIKPEGMREMLLKIDRDSPKGKRDFAILRLLWDNALRRNEVVGANIGDFDFEGRSLQILGKGRGSQKSSISLSIGTAKAIQEWLSVRETKGKEQPLFPSLDPAHRGHRLTGTAIYQIVEKLAIAAGITKKMSPHRIRHSAITAALDATNGNVRKVQKLSRHKKLDTLMLYDDNRTNMQGEVSSLLGDLI